MCYNFYRIGDDKVEVSRTMKIFKLCGSIITDLLIVLGIFIIIGNVYLISVGMKDDQLHAICGYKFLVELSDSMKDTIKTGDLVIIQDTDIKDIKKDDILSFRDEKNDAIITHRVYDVVEKGGKTFFETKGDNNKSLDIGLVKADSIEGVYVTKIANLGFVLVFLGSTAGKVVSILVLVIICLITLFIYELKKSNKNKKIEELEII